MLILFSKANFIIAIIKIILDVKPTMLTIGTRFHHSNKSRIIDHWYYSGTVEFNDKIWRIGGYRKFNGTQVHINTTEFMDEDSNWTEGPELPEPRSHSTMVVISNSKVFVFGGLPIDVASYLYDDDDWSFEPRAPIGTLGKNFVAAAYMTLPGIGKVVFAIQAQYKAITYDLDTDTWTLRPSLNIGPAIDVVGQTGFLSPSQR